MKILFLILASLALLALRGYPVRINPLIREEIDQLRSRGLYVPPNPDLTVRGVIIDSEYPIRAADDSQGWLGTKILITELEGRARPATFVFVRGFGYEHPFSGGEDVILQSHRNHLIRAQNGEVVVVFLRKNSQLSRRCAVPIYNNICAYRIENEANKAMEPTPVSVTDPAGAGPAPLTSVAHLDR